MARVKTSCSGPREIRIGLYDPGMTPMLRAGLGGLATSLCYHKKELETAAPGCDFIVEEDAVVIKWVGDAATFVQPLFEMSFQLYDLAGDPSKPKGLVFFPSLWRHRDHSGARGLLLMNKLQDAVRCTILQHCSALKSDGKITKTVQIEEKEQSFDISLCYVYNHMKPESWEGVAEVLNNGKSLPLAGWAQPGGGEEYRRNKNSSVLYTPGQALCAYFGIIGTLSYTSKVSGTLSVLAIPVPTNLLLFSEIRPLLQPHKFEDCVVSGSTDAALSIWNIISRLRRAPCIDQIYIMQIGEVASIPNQKSRRATYLIENPPDSMLDLHQAAMSYFPNKPMHQNPTVVFANHLRATITRNIATGKPWFRGWHDTRDYGHKYIINDEYFSLNHKRGLYQMSEHLNPAQTAFVRAIHDCFDKRFAVVANSYTGSQIGNKFDQIRDKFRLSLRTAKTKSQVRKVLSDFLSEGGKSDTFRHDGTTIMAMIMNPTEWEEVRDLALLAFATYGEGKVKKTAEIDTISN